MLGAPAAEAGDPGVDKNEPGAEVLEKYWSATSAQRDKMRDLSAEVIMDANIPKLKKTGKMSLLRHISNLGKVTYKIVNFWGDDTVKKEVIARYLTAETDNKMDPATIAITPDNYHFKFKGLQTRDGKRVYLFELKPRQKRLGLFKGELWLDRETALPIREAGRLVKNPSVFIKKMEFVRNYEIKDGMALLKSMESKTDTRVVGRADLNIEYANYRHADSEVDTEEARKTP